RHLASPLHRRPRLRARLHHLLPLRPQERGRALIRTGKSNLSKRAAAACAAACAAAYMGNRTPCPQNCCAWSSGDVHKPPMVKMKLSLLGLCLALIATPATAQSLGAGVDIPTDLRFFGPPDPNVRKASAIVNGSMITDLDLEHRLALVVAASGGRIGPEERNRLRVQVLRNLIDERLQILEAEAHDVIVDNAEVDATFARV